MGLSDTSVEDSKGREVEDTRNRKKLIASQKHNLMGKVKLISLPFVT